MDMTMLNAQLVTTGLKCVFYYLKSVDCERSDLWKSFGLVTNERMTGLILLLVRPLLRHYE